MNESKKRKLSLKKLIVFVALCFAAVVFINQFSRISYYNAQIKELEGKIDEQKQRESELSDRRDVYTSKEYVEKIAREKLGLLRANEKVYIDYNQQ